MKQIRRPCLECGHLHRNTSRCSEHAGIVRQPTHLAYSGPEYRRLRHLMLTEHRRQFGDWCPGAADLEHEAHPSVDLSIDHILPLSEGGTNERSNLRVLCQQANTAKGGSNRRREEGGGV